MVNGGHGRESEPSAAPAAIRDHVHDPIDAVKLLRVMNASEPRPAGDYFVGFLGAVGARPDQSARIIWPIAAI